MVGQVAISYDGETDTLTVTYELCGNFLLKEVHVHVGDDLPDTELSKLPKDKKGDYTVAPGQYGCGTHVDDDETCDFVFEENSSTATFTEVDEDFYVIAHAVVAGSDSDWSDGCTP